MIGDEGGIDVYAAFFMLLAFLNPEIAPGLAFSGEYLYISHKVK
jgi:hypothetical protein